MARQDNDLNGMAPTLKRAAAALGDAGIPSLLRDGVASCPRGGPPAERELDLPLEPEDAGRTLAAPAEAGMRPERPAQEWLLEARDGDDLVDPILTLAARDDGRGGRATGSGS